MSSKLTMEGADLTLYGSVRVFYARVTQQKPVTQQGILHCVLHIMGRKEREDVHRNEKVQTSHPVLIQMPATRDIATEIRCTGPTTHGKQCGEGMNNCAFEHVEASWWLGPGHDTNKEDILQVAISGNTVTGS